MLILIMVSIIVLSSIWWYTDLYKIITNFSDKLLIKNKLINMCISTIINIVVFVFIIDSIVTLH
jgi:hypothetical protein